MLYYESCDFLMGVSLYNYPPQQALIQNENHNLVLLNPEFENIQSQFYKECFVSNGTFYWAKKSVFLKQKNRILVRNEKHKARNRRIF